MVRLLSSRWLENAGEKKATGFACGFRICDSEMLTRAAPLAETAGYGVVRISGMWSCGEYKGYFAARQKIWVRSKYLVFKLLIKLGYPKGGVVTFIERFRKRRAIRSYIAKLPRLLAKNYGQSKHYTPQQIRRTIEREGLNIVYSCYGISMFSSREDFNQFHSENGESCDYDAMRGEVAHDHFSGNVEFTFADIFELSSHHETGTGHGGSHDSGGGHGHGSH